jgi:hypothetical protein
LTIGANTGPAGELTAHEPGANCGVRWAGPKLGSE